MTSWGTLEEEMQGKVLSHVLDPLSQWSSAYRNLLTTTPFSNRYVNTYGRNLKELLFKVRKVHCLSAPPHGRLDALVPALRADLLLFFDHDQQKLSTMQMEYVDGTWQCIDTIKKLDFSDQDFPEDDSFGDICVITPDARVGVHRAWRSQNTILTVFSPLDGMKSTPIELIGVYMTNPLLSPSGAYVASEVLVGHEDHEIHVYDTHSGALLHKVSKPLDDYPGETWKHATKFDTIHWLNDDTLRWLAWEVKDSPPPYFCTGNVRLYSLSVTNATLSYVQTRVSDVEFRLSFFGSNATHIANVGLNGWCATLSPNHPKCFSMLRLDPVLQKVDEEPGGYCSPLWRLGIEFVDLFTEGGGPSCFQGPYAVKFANELNDYKILEICQIHPRFLAE